MINMFKKKPILRYESSLEYYQNSIVPAKNNIPEWYKKIPQWQDNEMFNLKRGLGSTVKLCMPFFDAFAIGYMITLPYDIYITIDDDGMPAIGFRNSVIHHPRIRNNIASESLVPFGHHPVEFTWNYCVSYTLPKGFSGLFTHPLNRNDLPFTTISGVIDGGIVMNAHGNAPFYIKKDFEGIIEQGTPIAQLIPFRQENWKSKKTKNLVKIGDIHDNAGGSVFRGWYKKNFWTRKSYE